MSADAQRNGECILAAAEEVFLEKGASASLEDVTKRAGVGIGTLYRRFATREELLAATYSARFVAFAEASRATEETLHPSSALRAYLEELVRHTNVYRGLAASLGTVLQVETPGCLATGTQGARLLTRAQNNGAVRVDVTSDDLVCVATAISLATEHSPHPQDRIPHLVDIFMDGIGVKKYTAQPRKHERRSSAK